MPRWKSSALLRPGLCRAAERGRRAHFGLQPYQIMPGNGSDENLFFALGLSATRAHPLAYADITYGCYGVWCGLMHIPSRYHPAESRTSPSTLRITTACTTIVIANPNAPTGLGPAPQRH